MEPALVKRRASVLVWTGLVCTAIACAGCSLRARGLLYTDTIQPYCKDLRGTTLGGKSSQGRTKQIQIPTTRIDFSAEWDSRAIGDIAKANGISVVHGCESRVESVLLGLWRRDTIIIFGE